MTNSSRSSVLKVSAVSAVLLVLFAGCGPKDGSKELATAREAFRVKDCKKAEKFFLKAAACEPSFVDASLGLAELKLAEGKIKDAKSYWSQAERLAANDVDVRLLGAQIAWHAKDFSRAEKLFKSVAEDVRLSPELRSQGYAGLGIVEATCVEHELARIAYLRALRLDRRNASAWYHLGHLYRYAPFTYLEAALDHFEFYARLEEKASPRVQKTQRAIIPAIKEMIASQTIERLGSAKRDSAACAAAIMKAEESLKKGALKTASSHYVSACKADPLSYPAALGLAQTLLRIDASVAGKARALDAYRKACAIRPSAMKTLLETGRLAEQIGYYAQAREAYSRALAANPASLDAVDGLIRALRKTGQAEVAKAYQSYRDSLPKGGKKK